jgi:integrase
LTDPSGSSGEDDGPYSVQKVHFLLKEAGKRRNSARWAIALALGLRQGEALGLKWIDIDLDAGSLIVRRGRQRPRWQHGCKGRCSRKIDGHCPDRIALRTETADTKSRAGRRAIGLPDELVALLRKHRDEQAHERQTAAQLWQEGEWVFTTPTGQPVNPRTDYTEWKRLLKAAGLRDARLHDARHTAATVLLLLEVPERAVMSIMGWSNTAMAARYQHLTAKIRSNVAKRVGGLLWQTPETPPTAAGSAVADASGPALASRTRHNGTGIASRKISTTGVDNDGRT